MHACAAQREMGCRGVLKNNRSHFRLDHFPLKRMLIPAATINATRPAPSVIIRAKSTKSCSFCSGGKARENFSFLLHIIFVVVFFFQKMPVCGEIFFPFFFPFFFVPNREDTVDAPLAEPLTRRSFECLRYDFTFAHINADLNAFHI